MAFAFFSAWLTTELAVLHLAWQFVATVLFVALGALDRGSGWLGLAITLGVVVRARGRSSARRGARRRRSRPRSTSSSARAGATRSIPTWKPKPRPFEWRRVLFPFSFKRRGVERVRNIQYVDGDAARRHRLDVYRIADARTGRTGAAADPRRRLGDRQQGPAGPAAHVPPRGRRLGVRRDQLPPLPPGHVARRRSSTASARWRGSASTSPSTAATPTTSSSPAARPAVTSRAARAHAERPAVPARLRGRRHARAGDGAVLRRLRLDQPVRAARQRRRLRACSSAHREAALRRAPEVFDQASPMSHVNPDAPPALVIHGDLDTLAPVTEAREFVDMLREVSRQPGRLRRVARRAPRVRGLPVDPSLETITASTCSSRGCSPSTRPSLVAPPPRPANDAPAASAANDPTTTARTAPSRAPRARAARGRS